MTIIIYYYTSSCAISYFHVVAADCLSVYFILHVDTVKNNDQDSTDSRQKRIIADEIYIANPESRTVSSTEAIKTPLNINNFLHNNISTVTHL